ncbi:MULTISPECIES: hypothetical protein [Aerococcus]|uniref:Uncharacterized protein n=1 Tax=Aerococcus sanguinicola TaxID=119206 RepID=A0A5N1GHT7_9LACT|nr:MULTISPECIES: hypothetical protein [Aerococcus]KAA9299729.1 hypothetical protein F6I03_08895 [Aerococcus sanguinicola]MDK6369929.1 hypothetical protein [Aerococcus sp. UMB9870]MDK6680597.1 hypothetical protein [Aerococcus sp. UMB8608]MDK6687324.1 hypothetical protein [Aerococcus sp. UMB8623]MDK6940547.1 hypothetical protein [Aerococcus sp. UMB8487]
MKWQDERLKREREEHFQPFYQKKDDKLLTDKAQKPYFPNYMNWRSDLNEQKRDRQPQSYDKWWTPQSHQKEAQRQHRFDQARQQPINNFNTVSSRRPSRQREGQQDYALHRDEEREARYEKIRRDLRAYENYQFRRAFRPSEVPSIQQKAQTRSVKSSDQADYMRDKKRRQEATKAQAKHLIQGSNKPSKPHKAANQPVKSNGQKTSSSKQRQGGLNRDFQAIMAQERPRYAKGSVFAGLNDEDSKQTPYYSKHQGTGDKHNHE